MLQGMPLRLHTRLLGSSMHEAQCPCHAGHATFPDQSHVPMPMQVLVPLLNAEIDHTGPLAALIQDRGGYDKLRIDLQAAGVTGTKIEFPAPPCEQLAIAL